MVFLDPMTSHRGPVVPHWGRFRIYLYAYPSHCQIDRFLLLGFHLVRSHPHRFSSLFIDGKYRELHMSRRDKIAIVGCPFGVGRVEGFL